MINLLFALLVFALVVYVAFLIVKELEFPPKIKMIVGLILSLLFLLVLLEMLGFIPAMPGPKRWPWTNQ